MNDDENAGAKTPGWSADALRMRILREQMADQEARARVRSEEERRRADFAHDFMRHHVGPEELKHIRHLIEVAVRHGDMEALIYSFPSDLCRDDGRAINNAHPDWPETLQGKASELFETFERHLRPMGYQLKARIVTFPDGIPGDVGFFLCWAPPLP